MATSHSLNSAKSDSLTTNPMHPKQARNISDSSDRTADSSSGKTVLLPNKTHPSDSITKLGGTKADTINHAATEKSLLGQNRYFGKWYIGRWPILTVYIAAITTLCVLLGFEIIPIVILTAKVSAAITGGAGGALLIGGLAYSHCCNRKTVGISDPGEVLSASEAYKTVTIDGIELTQSNSVDNINQQSRANETTNIESQSKRIGEIFHCLVDVDKNLLVNLDHPDYVANKEFFRQSDGWIVKTVRHNEYGDATEVAINVTMLNTLKKMKANGHLVTIFSTGGWYSEKECQLLGLASLQQRLREHGLEIDDFFNKKKVKQHQSIGKVLCYLDPKQRSPFAKWLVAGDHDKEGHRVVLFDDKTLAQGWLFDLFVHTDKIWKLSELKSQGVYCKKTSPHQLIADGEVPLPV